MAVFRIFAALMAAAFATQESFAFTPTRNNNAFGVKVGATL